MDQLTTGNPLAGDETGQLTEGGAGSGRWLDVNEQWKMNLTRIRVTHDKDVVEAASGDRTLSKYERSVQESINYYAGLLEGEYELVNTK
mgnify:CR=1 FL=1